MVHLTTTNIKHTHAKKFELAKQVQKSCKRLISKNRKEKNGTHLKSVQSDTQFGYCQFIQLIVHFLIQGCRLDQLFLGYWNNHLLITSQRRSRRE